ncbi:hypothetical protein [Microlunatus soli]|uniref:hypothetical protein n=1 Tax=Microlunatus soli TaxID=630515 RepID=UPI0018D353D2|nr:hypothetical protein [Microlunatus soli]
MTEGWVQVRNARGNTGDHWIYELTLPDGRTLRTRVSHPVNRDTYGAAMWAHILREQLDVDEPAFWACVQDKVMPERGSLEPPEDAIPAGVVAQLLSNGVPDVEIQDMSRTDAIRRLNEIWSQPT